MLQHHYLEPGTPAPIGDWKIDGEVVFRHDFHLALSAAAHHAVGRPSRPARAVGALLRIAELPQLAGALLHSPGRELCLELRRRSAGPDAERKHVQIREGHTSELQSLAYLVCRLLLEKKKYT